MNRLVLILLLAFLFTSGAVISGDQELQLTDIVWCCDRGRCLRVTKEGCDKFGGNVVETCDDCQ